MPKIPNIIHNVKFSVSGNRIGEILPLTGLLGLPEQSMCTASLYFL